MTTLTPEDRARLRDLAAKATPGPWVRTGRDGRDYSLSPATGALLVDYAPIKQKCADAVYIAAADPATVTALLDALDAAEAELGAIKARDEEVCMDEGWWIGGAWGDCGEAVVPLRILSYVMDGELDQKVADIDPGFALTYAEQVARADRAEAEVERLRSWAGLMELLDEHYPADLIPTAPDDPAPTPSKPPTAEDFAREEFARHEDGRIAARLDDDSPQWRTDSPSTGVWRSDADMAEEGWSIVTPARDAGPRIVSLIRRVDAAEAARDTAERQVQAVRALHYPIEGIHGTIVCAHRHCVDDMQDQCEWPCPTIRALNAAAEAGR